MCLRDSIATARINGPTPEGSGVAFEFRFSPDDPLFKGHFPGHPILPGVCQIEMTRLAAEWLRGTSFSISRVVRAKFTRPIRPIETIRLRLTLTNSPQGTSARAQLSVGPSLAGDIALELLE